MREIVVEDTKVKIGLTSNELDDFFTDVTECKALLDGKVWMENQYLCFRYSDVKMMVAETFISVPEAEFEIPNSIYIYLTLGTLIYYLIMIIPMSFEPISIWFVIALCIALNINGFFWLYSNAKQKHRNDKERAVKVLVKSLCFFYMVMFQDMTHVNESLSSENAKLNSHIIKYKEMYLTLLGTGQVTSVFPDGEIAIPEDNAPNLKH